jgi:hypothetical protein
MRLRRGRFPMAVAGVLTLAGVATALSPGAVADVAPLDGIYTNTILDHTIDWMVGRVQTVTFTPCGPDCVHWDLEGNSSGGFNLYRKGDVWMREPVEESLVIIDGVTLKGTAAGLGDLDYHQTFQLTKIG